MKICVDLRQKYGFKETSTLFNVWVGEDLFDQALYRFNIDLKRKLNFNAPPDFQEPNANEIYIHHVRSLALNGKLKITDTLVYDEMSTTAVIDFEKQRLQDFPVLAAVAYVLYSMDLYRPWLQGSTVFNYDDSELIDW
ncbi:hypothetical protein ACFL0S_00580 [Thermodesulfobacteriota bacterium]